MSLKVVGKYLNKPIKQNGVINDYDNFLFQQNFERCIMFTSYPMVVDRVFGSDAVAIWRRSSDKKTKPC